MSVIATITVQAGDFTLGTALAADPELRIRLERVVPLGESFVPFFWASAESVDQLEAALRTEGDIDSFDVLDTTNGEALVWVRWRENVDGLVKAIASSEGKILEAVGQGQEWTIQLRFPAHGDLSTFYQTCVDKHIAVDLQSVHAVVSRDADDGSGELTDTQRETLAVALENGYFEVPRKITLVDLAEMLDVSDTAASQRLRRGITTLLRGTFDTEETETEAVSR